MADATEITVNHVSYTAIWFLVGVVCSTVVLIVLFLYLSKRACFRECQGCDRFLEPGYHRAGESLARSFDDSDTSSSSDSEEENFRYMQRSLRKSQSLKNSQDSLASVSKESLIQDQPSQSAPEAEKASFSPHELSEGSDFNTSPSHGEIEATGLSSPSASQRLSSSRTSLSKSRTSLYSEKEFHRKAIKRSPGTPRSTRSLTPSLRSSEWNIDAESIYKEGKLSPSSMDYREGDDDVPGPSSQIPARPGDSADEERNLSPEIEPISACGTLDVAVQYIMSEQKLQVTIIEAHDLPSKARGGSSIIQVRAVLLPAKRKKYKTKVQHIGTPKFAETFKLSRASPEELKGLALRLRLYGIGKVKDRLVGEAIIRFDELNLIRDPQLTIQLQLEPRTDINRVASDPSIGDIGSRSSSMMSLSHGGSPPELLVGLSYNPPTGRLCVEVIKGSHFRHLAMTKPPDTYVKLSLLNSGCQEMSQSKTTVRRAQPNPVYKETFYFQVALFQLGEVTLMVSVYNRRTLKKKEMIGWVSMGRNSSSEPDEQHWQEMKEGKGQQVCRWHTLIDT